MALTVERLEQKKFLIGVVARNAGVDPATVWRWTTRGVRGVRLRTERLGGRRVVLESDLNEFFAAISGETQAAAVPSNVETKKNTAKKAADELARRGM